MRPPRSLPAMQRPIRHATGLARQAAAWLLWALLAWSGHTAAQPATQPAAQATTQPTTQPTTQATAQPASDLTLRILALESAGRAQPDQAVEQLQALLGRTREYSAERLELLTVQGLILAESSQHAAAERAALALEAWSRESDVPLAREATTAGLLIRASSAARGGSTLQKADALLQVALARVPKDMLARSRYRFVFFEGYVKDLAGKLEDAVRLNHEALTLADGLDEPWRQSEARTALAYSYYGAKQLERARTFSLEAIAIAEKAHDWTSLGRAHNTAGIVLDGMGDAQGERHSFDLAIDCARRAGAKGDEVRYLANLADFFLKKGDFKTALAHAERALPLARELKDSNSEMVAMANIGLAHISMQHLELGKRYVRDAIAIDEQRGAMTGVSDTYLELGGYLERAGDIAGAVEAYHHHRRLAASLMRSDQQKAILAMQEQYDADRRTRSIELLKREKDIKAEQLRQRDLQQRLWWLVAAILALSFGVIALLVRRVRQTNELLASSNEALKLQTERDPLTGLSNRRHFQALMRQVAGDGSLRGTVCLIDIDHFKHINDQYGHATGDAVLVEVARRLKGVLGEQDLLVRWGGEEFLVMVQSLAPERVNALAQRLLGALHDFPVAAGAHRVAVSGSIGFATFPIGPSSLRVSWERAINLVDTAMYLAKAHGRNRAYGVALQQAGDDRLLDAIVQSLETAWREGKVELTLLKGGAAAPAPVAARVAA